MAPNLLEQIYRLPVSGALMNKRFFLKATAALATVAAMGTAQAATSVKLKPLRTVSLTARSC